jgi:hypothetical protein
MSNPFTGMIRKTKSIELGGLEFHFKPLSMGAVYKIQQIEDGNKLAEALVVQSICDKEGVSLKGFKAEYLQDLSPAELMELVKFAQSVSMPNTTEKKS